MENKKNQSMSPYLARAAVRLPLTVHACRFPWRDMAENRAYTNPYELLSRGNKAAVSSMLAASATVTGVKVTEDAPDYDKFAALCAAMPQWAGHPLYAAMHGVLAHTVGSALPMTAANAPLIWKYFAAETAAAPIGVLDALGKLGVGTVHLCLTPDELTQLADRAWMSTDNRPTVIPVLCLDEPRASAPTDLAAYTAALTEAIGALAAMGGTRVTVGLPDGWTFVRPNPYGAGEVLKKLSAGQDITHEEHCLWLAQRLRVIGQACVQHGVTFAVTGATSTEVNHLIAYLTTCDGHGTLRYTPTVPGEMTALLGALGVTFGLPLTAADTPQTIKPKLAAHAAHAPLGALDGVDVPVQALTDVWTIVEARRALCDLLVAWSENGAASRDPEALSAILSRV